jgi:hypothetical protein
MLDQELGHGAGIAGQEFAMRPTGSTMMSALNHRFAGQPLVAGSRPAVGAEQPSDLG